MDNEDEPVGRDQGKQRKILLLLAPLLAIMLFLQGPTLLGLITGSDEAENGSDEATASADTASPDAGASAGSALGPGTANAVEPAEPVFVIVHSDLPPRADADELTTLNRFAERDPFVPIIDGSVGGDAADESDEGSSGEDADTEAAAAVEDDTANAADDSSSSDADDAANTGGAEDINGNPTVSGDDSGAATEARIQVNGASSLVRIGSAFPSFDPVFRLESVAGDAVRIGLVRGSYSTGSELVDIEPGETRTLVSQPDGTRYRIRLVEVVS